MRGVLEGVEPGQLRAEAAARNRWRTEWLHHWEMPFLVRETHFQCAHGLLGQRPRKHPLPCGGPGVLAHQVLLKGLGSPVLLNQPHGDRASTFPRSFAYAEDHGLQFVGVGQAGAVCAGLFGLPDGDLAPVRERLAEAYREAFDRSRYGH